jgi:transposase
MLADDMRVVLSNHEDFANEKTIVEHFLHDRGHLAFFVPKFHCELNAIERVWGQAIHVVETMRDY